MEGVKVETRTTTTRTTTTATTASSGPFTNLMYFKTLPGILKWVQVLFGIISVALASDPHFAVTHFFLFVCWTALIITIGWIVIIFFRINERYIFRYPWVHLELWCTIGVLLFYFLAMVLQFTKLSGYQSYSGSIYVERHTAAAVFALFNVIAYTVSVFLLFMQTRSL